MYFVHFIHLNSKACQSFVGSKQQQNVYTDPAIVSQIQVKWFVMHRALIEEKTSL